jgi:hypothetical protein
MMTTMTKVDVHAERAARLVDTLRQQRDQGSAYPLTVARLRELVDPELSDDDLFKALLHRSQASNVVVAAKKDPASPVALAEDAARLAASDVVLVYALGKLATADKPLHPVARVVSRVDRGLQPAFEAALNDRLAGTLPQGVGKQERKGKVQLYLERFPPPPVPPEKPTAAALAEKLLAALTARRQQGERVVNLAELAEPDVSPALLKKAVGTAPFGEQAIVVPVGKTLTLAALVEEREHLLGSNRLLLALLEEQATPKKPFATLADLAARLPEGLGEGFTAAWAPRLASRAVPGGVLVRGETLCLEADLPATMLLGEKVLTGLERRRQAGQDYPLPLETLVQAEAPGTPADLVEKLAGDRDFKSKAILAVPGDVRAPVALAADEERLASSPALIEFAVRRVSTPEQPLQPVKKVAGVLERTLRAPFEQAVARLVESGALPATVAAHDVKGKLHLRRADYPLPPPPDEALAGKFLSALKASRQAGTDYPLPLARLIERVDAAAPERLVKAALGHELFSAQVLAAQPGKRESLVALSEDRDRLAADPRLLEQALTGTRTPDNQAVPLSDLGKKLAADLRPPFTTAVEQRLSTGTLPASVGVLVIRKKPHLFLLADLTGRVPPAAPKPQAAEKPPAPPAEFISFSSFNDLFDEAFARLAPTSHGLVSLVDLRQSVPVERDVFDEGLNRLRRAGRYSLQGAEGRHGITAEEREAGIVEHGNLLLFVSRREEA